MFVGYQEIENEVDFVIEMKRDLYFEVKGQVD